MFVPRAAEVLAARRARGRRDCAQLREHQRRRVGRGGGGGARAHPHAVRARAEGRGAERQRRGQAPVLGDQPSHWDRERDRVRPLCCQQPDAPRRAWGDAGLRDGDAAREGHGECDSCVRRERARAAVWCLGFRVQGSGSRVWGSGFGVQGLGFRVWGPGFKLCGLGFRVSWARGAARATRARAPTPPRTSPRRPALSTIQRLTFTFLFEFISISLGFGI